MFKNLYKLFFVFVLFAIGHGSANQTNTISPIYPQASLPFDINIQQASFNLPSGIHSGAYAVYKGKWFFIAGRTNGLHGFGPGIGNFPPSQQNTNVYVVDLKNQVVYSRSLSDPTSGLNQEQIDLLSVTSPQSFYTDSTLYICGGYGVDTATGTFSTKSSLIAIDLEGMIDWVINPNENSAIQNIKQTSHPLLQVTGGYMASVNSHLSTLLIFGQNFEGYYTDSANGNYTQQVRRFKIVDKKDELYIVPKKSENPNPNYRRRDLNVVPVIKHGHEQFVALSGVFTLDSGIWTVPVEIKNSGESHMDNPDDPDTFKQGMNNYVSPTVGLYSQRTKNMYIVLLGGISYGYFDNGVFETDSEFPFINQVTTVKIDQRNHYSQYIMDNQYPTILSTGSNPGNQLLFGAGAYFIPVNNLCQYDNGVIKLDRIKKPVLVGYIVGGIMSTLPNTNDRSDSTASPYIFEVLLTPR